MTFINERPFEGCIWKFLKFCLYKSKASIISHFSEHGKIMRIASLSFGSLSFEALFRGKGRLIFLNETDSDSDFKAYFGF